MRKPYDPYVTHIGGGRSRAIEPLPAMPRVLIAIPACHKFEYGKWESEQSPHYDQAKAYNGVPYGTNIHISGDNPRIDAVRDTWAKDIAPFSAHVDLKFFYGTPHPRPALPDEVYIPCPDDYASLPLKTIEICKYAEKEGYDFLFKCDDDSYVWVDRLVKELVDRRFDYGGYEHGGVCTGGPGYWLGKRAVKLVADSGQPDHWAEDCWVAKVMSWNNIRPTMLPNHYAGMSAHWFDLTKIPVGAVCIHAVKPEGMRELYERSTCQK